MNDKLVCFVGFVMCCIIIVMVAVSIKVRTVMGYPPIGLANGAAFGLAVTGIIAAWRGLRDD